MKRALTAFLLVLLFGCGVKGPPEPPDRPTPETPRKPSLRVRGECVDLAWKESRTDEPGSLPADFYEVLRANQPLEGEPPAFMTIARVRTPYYSDCSLEPGARVVYSVRALTREGRRSEPTASLKAAYLVPPPPPTGGEARSGDGYADLSWDPPAEFPGQVSYNVYRAREGALLSRVWKPVNPSPVTGTSYSDGPLENGTPYFYEVRTQVLSPGFPPVESSTGIRFMVTPADRVPPLAPKGFTAAWTEEGVSMSWFNNEEKDLAGYLVYRRRPGMGDFRALTLDPIAENRYLDRTARRGVEYEYAVSAVDNASTTNESELSGYQFIYSEP